MFTDKSADIKKQFKETCSQGHRNWGWVGIQLGGIGISFRPPTQLFATDLNSIFEVLQAGNSIICGQITL